MIDLKFKLGRKEISQIFIYHLTLRNIRFRFLMFFPQKSQETSLSLLYLCHNYIDCCSILLTILLYHCFRHLWFSIRQVRRQLYSQNKSQDAKSLRCLKPLFPKRRRVFVLIIALFWYKRLLFFSRATGIITSNAGNIEMAKVILISL